LTDKLLILSFKASFARLMDGINRLSWWSHYKKWLFLCDYGVIEIPLQ